MDIKAAIIAVCLLACGYMFYVNKQRSDALVELNQKYQTLLAKGSNSTATATPDEALMNAIREQVRAEIAARPASNCAISANDTARMQEIKIKTAELEDRFNKALALLMDGSGVNNRDDVIAAKATKIKDRVLALCKK